MDFKTDMSEFYQYSPYELGKQDKEKLLFKRLNELTECHMAACQEYANMIDAVFENDMFCCSKHNDSNYSSEIGTGIENNEHAGHIDNSENSGSYYADCSEKNSNEYNKNSNNNVELKKDNYINPKHIEDIPFLPVSLFKKMELKSIPKEQVFKTMTSSGTTGQAVSKMFLDRETAKNQQKVLVEIVSSFTGNSRMPMIILDCPSVVKNRAMFSARGAGILGFSIFGSKRIYAFDDDMSLNVELLQEFLEKYKDETIFLFGFTFMIWEFFYKKLRENTDISINLENAVLIHGGGWKKLINQAVSRDEFKAELERVCGIKKENIHDYYGMVEQTGSIYMECECGHLHTSIYSDVITRRMKDFSVCDFGEEGVIEVVSALPESYPGHAILTEDIGVLLGEDDCPCGRKGKYFTVKGRMAKAEVRGCSDTFTKK